MQVLIEIPNPPKRQEIVDIPLHFIDGDVCEAGGYGFKVLSPHGRLIDGDELISDLRIYESKYCGEQGYVTQDDIIDAPTILEAETNANQCKPTHKCVKSTHKCVEREDKRTDATADKSSQLTGRTTDDWY